MTTMRPGGVDDRFGQPLEATRRGAHRARPTFVAVVLPTLAVLAVIAVVGAVSWGLLGGGLSGGDGDSTTAAGATLTPSGTATASASATATASATPTPSATTPSATTPSATSSVGGAVDKSLAVRVLNNTETAGLAKKAADAIAASGWTVGEVGNFLPRGSLDATTVYFAKKAQRDTAAALAAELGVEVVKDTEAADGSITLVLGPDYEP